MKPRQCRVCGALIVFVRTPNGKAMPCYAAKVYYKEDGGRDTVVTDAGRVCKGTITNDYKNADGFAYRPHWASCPGASRIKKQIQKQAAEQMQMWADRPTE